MKIALLGGTGFVGKNVSKELDEQGIEYMIASRKNGIDLRDFQQAMAFFNNSKPDYIINCAAHVGSLNYVTEQAADVILDNSRMILSTYEAIAKAAPNAIVINPIANCAYPAHSETFVEDNWWNGHLHRSVLSYGSSRRLLWSVAESFSMQHQIKSINFLVPNMYGAYDSTDPNKAHALNALVSRYVKAKENGDEEIELWGTGIAIREWLYAKDFGKLLVQVIKNPDIIGLSEPLNVAQNFGISIKELIHLIISNFDYQPKIKWDTSKPDGAPKKVMDDRRFRKIFPDFEFTLFDTGIKNTIKYYQSIFPY